MTSKTATASMGMPENKLEVRQEGVWRELYLAGRRVRAGDAVELLLPGDLWVRARLERPRTHKDEEVLVRLYLPLGGEWERWTPPPRTSVGDEIDLPCEDCQGVGGDPTCWCEGTGRVRQEVAPPIVPQLCVPVDPSQEVTLRWPSGVYDD